MNASQTVRAATNLSLWDFGVLHGHRTTHIDSVQAPIHDTEHTVAAGVRFPP